MDRLNITDLRKLKFKRVCYYKVLFIYDNKEYIMIHDGEDEGHISLFERVKVKENRYVLDSVSGIITCKYPGDFIKDISKKKPKHMVYSNINREWFVKQLIETGLADGIYSEDYNKLKSDVDKINEEIRKLQGQISSLYKNWRTTSNKGSKCYSNDIKAKMAERVVGAKEGDWCDQYQAIYGSTHPEYGGVLVDLYSLPVGTYFWCENGNYPAMISYNSHGDKIIVTDNSEVKLTKEHHSLYISIRAKDE